MTRNEFLRRSLLMIVSMLIIGFGVAVTKHAELGVSPVSSVANVLNARFPQFSLGTMLIFWHSIMLLAQLLILGRSFKPYRILQIAAAFLLGVFTDLGTALIASLTVSFYPARILLSLIGTCLIGFGCCLCVNADILMNPADALVKTISDTRNIEYGTVKIFFDIFCVSLAIILSLLFFDFKIIGTREGTILAAFFTGTFMKLFGRLLNAPLQQMLRGGHPASD